MAGQQLRLAFSVFLFLCWELSAWQCFIGVIPCRRSLFFLLKSSSCHTSTKYFRWTGRTRLSAASSGLWFRSSASLSQQCCRATAAATWLISGTRINRPTLCGFSVAAPWNLGACLRLCSLPLWPVYCCRCLCRHPVSSSYHYFHPWSKPASSRDSGGHRCLSWMGWGLGWAAAWSPCSKWAFESSPCAGSATSTGLFQKIKSLTMWAGYASWEMPAQKFIGISTEVLLSLHTRFQPKLTACCSCCCSSLLCLRSSR